MIKISVIMPVFNDEEKLNGSINSVLNQTLTEIELICVDDGSTDNSLSILNDFAEKDDRIRVFSQKNQGSGKARNKGISEAKGEYIAFLDSDDQMVDNDALNQLYTEAKKNNVDMASGGIQFVDKGKISYEFSCFKPITELKLRPVGDYCLPWYFYKNIFKRSLLIENDIRFPDLLRGQDPIFLVEILSHLDNFLEVPVLYYSYVTPDYIKVDNSLKYYDYFVHYYLVFKLLMADKKFKNSILRYSEILIAMKDRPIHINTVEELFKLLDVMDKIKSLYVKYGDINLTNKITSSFDELISKIEIEGFEISINKNQFLSDFYSEGIIVKDKKYNPKITVVLPVDNVEKYSPECLDLVLNQTMDDIEIICIDDEDIIKLKQDLKKYKLKEIENSKYSLAVNKYNHILFYDKGLKHDYNVNWNKNAVNMFQSDEGTIVAPNSGNWFSPLVNGADLFLPNKFKIDIDLVEYSPVMKIILSNSNGESFIKGLDMFEKSQINHLTIEYDEWNIKYHGDEQIIEDFYNLGDKISIRIDLWGSKKLIYKEFLIRVP